MMQVGWPRRQNGFQSMGYDPDFLTRLLGASRLLEQGQDLEQGLRELAGMTAKLLGTQKCSIMLLSASDGEEPPLLRVFAHYGDLPVDAYREVTRFNQGIAGRVLATGVPLLIADIADSPFADAARRGRDDRHRSLISAPIPLGERTIGVINVDSPLDGRRFSDEDLRLVEVFALFVGKSIHVVQLQNVLRSELVQYAIAREEGAEPQVTRPISPDPEHLARIVSRSIYRQLHAGGFSPAQIINVAAGVMDELRASIVKEKGCTGANGSS
jgi:L-methionine (R)-S-oxide reductase